MFDGLLLVLSVVAVCGYVVAVGFDDLLILLLIADALCD